MYTWDDVRAQITAGNFEVVAAMLTMPGEIDRRTIAAELPGYIRDGTGGTVHWTERTRQIQALLVAGAACIPGAAAVANWLCRADLDRLDINAQATAHARLIAQVVADRPAPWRAEVARRISRRLRVADQASWGSETHWRLADVLARGAGEGLPEDDAYLVGWVRWTRPYPGLNEEPYLDVLVPRLFEVEAVGRVLGGGPGDDPWIDMLLRLAGTGRVKRELLLDGCVRRFLRGGRIQDLRWYAALYRALEPSLTEVSARTRDLSRLLPAAPSQIAALALDELRRVDDAGELDDAAFAEAAEALLFRPERKLVRATFSWIDRTARKRDRVDATLAALTVAFGQESIDLRERAANIAAKHAAKAGEAAHDDVRRAAAGLPKEARDRIAETFGTVTVTAVTTPPARPAPPPPPRELPPPIASVAELTEEMAVHLRGDLTWADGERVLAGLVQFAHREPDETRAAMRRLVPDVAPWLPFEHDRFGDHPTTWLGAALCSLVPPTDSRPYPASPPDAGDRGPAPTAVLRTRLREIVGAVGRLPVLLSTPTCSTGHISPEVLVERLERLEAAGLRPGPFDLDQALLRLPRDLPDDIVLRAQRLTSPEGRWTAAWLADRGMPDPAVICTAVSLPRTVYSWRGSEQQDVVRVLPTVLAADSDGVVPDPDGVAGRLLDLPHGGEWTRLEPATYAPSCFSWWPSLLPSHREILAAHLLVPLADRTEARDGQGAVLLALAEADGPVGPAMATALALGLTSRRTEERSASVDAFLTFCARGQLPAVGEAIAALDRQLKLKPGDRRPDRCGPRRRASRRPPCDHLCAPGAALPSGGTSPGRSGRPHRPRHRGGGDRCPVHDPRRARRARRADRIQPAGPRGRPPPPRLDVIPPSRTMNG
ncbi:DUF6493 family protein [Actinomadura rudentiformis]|uniref:Secreted protein n=1 Tax=Actinomadura rudentiformis TaxID=359158 RepID=A0A6H9YIY2_9ACTN|nr:DUF6493 family protein [Actinomadura rudentiformis]KAB2345259.1 hypothetical protein F8566_28795 [Actinomadura rudentiformis]